MTRPDAPDDHGDAPAPDDAPTLTLGDALKVAGFFGTGGQAKRAIQTGEVRVNGEVETRRKRRLRPGDEIELGDETFVIELDSEANDA